MKNSTKKVLAIALAITTCFGLASCGKKEVADGKVRISIADWPEKGTDAYESRMKRVAEFNEKYPDIEIVGDTYGYAVNTFSAKASAGTLPTFYKTWFTEVDKITEAGYAADLTDVLDEAGWLQQMNKDILPYLSGKDGRVYGLPTKVYAMGLLINKPMFEAAGLVDENGNVKIPKTYEELYEEAKTIREKTGKAGYAICTLNNCGGWHSINFAWAYGAEFLAKKDGKYVSTMDSPETVAAFEWLKKMRAANVFPDNPNIQVADIQALFAANQVAMYFGELGHPDTLAKSYGMKPEDIVYAALPAGPKGSFSQMGGDLWMIAPNATPEQIDACLKWFDFMGHGPTFSDETIERAKESYKTTIKEGGVVIPKEAFYFWTNEERIQKTEEARKEFVNIPEENLASYYAFEGVTIRPEPEAGCQELYSEIDKVIQEIFSNADVDVAKLIKEASDNWQVNCLDNLK